MSRRRVWMGMLAAVAATVAVLAAVLPAFADPQSVTVHTLGGESISVTVDAPPGTSCESIKSSIPSSVLGNATSVDCPPPTSAPPAGGAQPGPDGAAPTPGAPPGPTPEAPGSVPGAPGPEGLLPPGTRDERARGRRDDGPGGKREGDEDDDGSGGKAQGETPRGRRDGTARGPGGAPTSSNPSLSLSLPGPAPIGVPNFFIEKFRIPPFLLSIYQAAGTEYNVPWQVLAAINEIETDYGRNLNVSSAGAMGWMQFIPSSWKAYGVDANKDGRKDPYNPVDAIFAAGRYLRAADADKDIRRAVFAYNHADWYVDSVMLRAKLIGGLPDALLGSLTGLTQGHFPVHGRARYADDIDERVAKKRVKRGQNAAVPVEAATKRRDVDIFAKPGTPVIAVNDGIVKQLGQSERLGKFVVVEDGYGNRYTYSQLRSLAEVYPVPKPVDVSRAQITRELKLPPKDPTPTKAASATGKKGANGDAKAAKKGADKAAAKAAAAGAPAPAAGSSAVSVKKERLFAHPSRPNAYKAGGQRQLLEREGLPGYTTFKSYFTQVFGLDRDDVVLKRMRKGSRVIAGTILGRIGKTQPKSDPHVGFEIRPAGRGAPKVDPKPILDGWKLLESTAIYRAADKNPLTGPDAQGPSPGQVLLMSKESLARQVVNDPRIDLYSCGRRDIAAGAIDRRVLATLEFLASSGLRPTVTSLKCGHGFYTKSGSVSHHSSGNAVDIAAINGTPILGNQGKGTVTEMAIRRLLTLQGTMKPSQIISLMEFQGTDNTISMGDHDDHIHVGFQPQFNANSKLGKQIDSALKPGQWIKLIQRLNHIDNPTVPVNPSEAAIPSRSHAGD